MSFIPDFSIGETVSNGVLRTAFRAVIWEECVLRGLQTLWSSSLTTPKGCMRINGYATHMSQNIQRDARTAFVNYVGNAPLLMTKTVNPIWNAIISSGCRKAGMIASIIPQLCAPIATK